MQSGFSLVWKGAAFTSRIQLSEGAVLSASEILQVSKQEFRQDFLTANTTPRTLATVAAKHCVFTFRLGDVCEEAPIRMDPFGVAVLQLTDRRSWKAFARRHGETALQKILREPEASFPSVAARTRHQVAPTWLGLGRDAHLFKIACSTDRTPMESDLIWPRQGSIGVRFPGFGERDLVYGFVDGRGQGPSGKVRRFLEQDCLPILHKHREDGDVVYQSTFFTTLQKNRLSEDTVKGTPFLLADSWTYGCTQTGEETKRVKSLADRVVDQPMLCIRLRAINHGNVSRYAWFKTLRPGTAWADQVSHDLKAGFSRLQDGSVFCVSRLGGAPLPHPEAAILLKPGEAIDLEMYLPHTPVSAEEAAGLITREFDSDLADARNYWSLKLARAAQFELPEKRVHNMIRAGILHLETATYGENSQGPLAPSVGCYCPIGTESAPIIQVYDSIGRHDLARRCLDFFLAKQRSDGSMQNFGGYMGETGAVLWTLGEHFRYTRDIRWASSVTPHVRRAAEFLIQLRNREPAGLIAGRVADPNDPYRQFMLNGYGYLGLSRAAELTRETDPKLSGYLTAESSAWRTDIRAALFKAMEQSPVVPLGDGNWYPTAPPWVEEKGPRALYLNHEPQFSHGSFAVADSLLGPLHLIFCEVLEPDEAAARYLLEVHGELFCEDNTALSQPYYSRHDWLQLRLGLVKGFLKTWYTSFAALADRETYTFWEHLHGVSEHKTHEEAWFLMATRWMLYQERGDDLHLLAGMPRQWLKKGRRIAVQDAKSYFGPLTFHVEHGSNACAIEVDCRPGPRRLFIRIPHPGGLKARAVTGGTYDSETETVLVSNFQGRASLELRF